MRQCPKCRQVISFDRLEEREKEEEQARELCMQLEKVLEGGDLAAMQGMIRELAAINDNLNIQEIGEFLSYIMRKAKSLDYTTRGKSPK